MDASREEADGRSGGDDVRDYGFGEEYKLIVYGGESWKLQGYCYQ
jgi:hypothetical protein